VKEVVADATANKEEGSEKGWGEGGGLRPRLEIMFLRDLWCLVAICPRLKEGGGAREYQVSTPGIWLISKLKRCERGGEAAEA